MFNNVYKGKTVLVTGHTGFKGSWLALWLTHLGARVVGYSAYLPSEPCNFEVTGIKERISHVEGDIRDMDKLKAVFSGHKPDIVFHLAAQSLVKRSYAEPGLTFETNLGGTVNVLECIRSTPEVRAAVLITSDKCYKNVEWIWGYRENDALGGDDPYSASKACAEIAAHAYIESFFRHGGNRTHISTTRAGNVIGGGDWAADRIIPDCVRAWSKGEEPLIRNPDSTRPWQLVLEPLSGYLWLGADLYASDSLHGEAFNFGPDQKVKEPVRDLIEEFLKYWGKAGWRHEREEKEVKEAMLLKLSCDKALSLLDWSAVLAFEETVRLTAEWYKAYYGEKDDMHGFSLGQIDFYSSRARARGLPWAEGGKRPE
jgi:CDP-glucose 4,6-dehydratase